MGAHGVETLDAVRAHPTTLVGNGARVGDQLRELKAFLYANLYFHHRLIRMTRKADHILDRTYHAYLEAPDMLPPDVRRSADRLGLERAVVDYLAGMTDRYATDEYRRLFDPTALT